MPISAKGEQRHGARYHDVVDSAGAEPSETAWQDVHSSFERFCLTAGIGALEEMLREDAERLAGPRHGRNLERAGRRWGATRARSASTAGRWRAPRAGAQPRRPRGSAAELAGGAGRGLARPRCSRLETALVANSSASGDRSGGATGSAWRAATETSHEAIARRRLGDGYFLPRHVGGISSNNGVLR